MNDETQRLGRMLPPDSVSNLDADAPEEMPVFCPNCRSTDTIRYANSGAAELVAYYLCRRCGRPFEHILQ